MKQKYLTNQWHQTSLFSQQLRREGRVADVNDVVARGQKVKVKVLSIAGTKIRLSMKDVDQNTGEDLNPKTKAKDSSMEIEESMRNPDRPSNLPLVTLPEADDTGIRKRVQRVTSPEKWELKQVCKHLFVFLNIHRLGLSVFNTVLP